MVPSLISSEKIFSRAGVDVIYKTQAGRQDRRHLVVVFSGFCPLGKYNFDGTVANGCRFDILWIKDEFEGNNSYYMCRDMDFSIENIVIDLIQNELDRLDLKKSDCTLMGYSKGGTAALFYGLKYEFKNIIASGPQMHFGSFSREHFNSSFRHMTKTGTDVEVEYLDSIVPDTLRNNSDFQKNIYLISSRRDQFHESEIVPYLDIFRQFSNFNLLMTESDLVSEHKFLGAYNTPLILSLLYSLGEGLVPAYVENVNGGNRHQISVSSRADYFNDMRGYRHKVVTLDRERMSNGRFFPEGVALMKGYEQSDFGNKSIKLRFKSNDGIHEYPLGSYRDASFSTRFFDRYFCNYSGAGYKSIDSKGVDLRGLPYGVYAVSARTTLEGDVEDVVPAVATSRSFAHFHDDAYYYWSCNDQGAQLVKRKVASDLSVTEHFELKKFEIVDGSIFIEGIFAVRGVSAAQYDNNRYALVLESNSRVVRIPLAQGNRANIGQRVDSGYVNHSKAYFTTPKYNGIALSEIPPGTYRCKVSWFYEGSVISSELSEMMLVRSDANRSVLRSRVSVFLRGSVRRPIEIARNVRRKIR